MLQKSGIIGFDEMFTIENTTPFKSIDTSLVKMITRDSMPVSFGVKLDTLMNRYEFPVKIIKGVEYIYVTERDVCYILNNNK